MKQSDDGALFGVLIGAGAAPSYIRSIPANQDTAGDGSASIGLGFPPETFLSPSGGGKYTDGRDFNGFLNLLSRAIQRLQAGYLGQFNADFANSIGGYPKGAIIAGSNAGEFFISTADSNVTDPSSAGSSWKNMMDDYALQSWVSGNFVGTPAATNGNNDLKISSAAWGYGYSAPYLRGTDVSGESKDYILATRDVLYSYFSGVNGNATLSNLQGVNWTSDSINSYVQVTAGGVSLAVPTLNYIGQYFVGGDGRASMTNFQGVNWTENNPQAYLQATGDGISMAIPTLSYITGLGYATQDWVKGYAQQPLGLYDVSISATNTQATTASATFIPSRSGNILLNFNAGNDSGQTINAATVTGSGFTKTAGGLNWSSSNVCAGTFILQVVSGESVNIDINVVLNGTASILNISGTAVLI
ncbi:hypothetical protein [Acetobacter sp.]|uniref:hypothetical protein n=1 Tax=Acetobacter sp. TaxID=440 RepID=UPI0039E743D4